MTIQSNLHNSTSRPSTVDYDYLGGGLIVQQKQREDKQWKARKAMGNRSREAGRETTEIQGINRGLGIGERIMYISGDDRG